MEITGMPVVYTRGGSILITSIVYIAALCCAILIGAIILAFGADEQHKLQFYYLCRLNVG